MAEKIRRITAPRRFTPTIVSLATAYDDQSTEDIVLPESFEGVETSDIQALHTRASEAFATIYGDGSTKPSDSDFAKLSDLTEVVEKSANELAARETADAQRASDAAALAARVQGTLSADTSDGEGDTDGDSEGEADGDEDEDETEGGDGTQNDEGAAETVVASGATRSELRVSMADVRRQAPTPKPQTQPSMRDIVRSTGQGTGFAQGAGMDFADAGKAIQQSLMGYQHGVYATAAKRSQTRTARNPILAIERKFDKDVIIETTDRTAVDAAFARATDESRLIGKNNQRGLVAAGGWCSPSETVYDLLEMETRSGLLSLPEVGINRGGLQFTKGPSYAELFSQIVGFTFTEQDDIDGKYQPGANGNVEGPKPCFHIECPDFEEVRLEGAGLCLTAGLLQSRAYPEVIARTVRGALIAHEHRMNALLISRLVAGSDAVNMGNQAGTVAPVLDSIEKQVQHYRAIHRLDENATLEAVFPNWVRAAMRSDLSRRLGGGVDLIEVTNERIDAWFRARGVNPQFVYNWQDLAATSAGAFTAWPTTVSFLLYSAGTWVRGSTDIITLDTMYDSTLLSTNDYTALFTEEGWLVAKRGFDSRVVTVGISADGVTAIGQDIAHNGQLAPAAAVPGATEASPLFTQEVTAG